LSAAQQVNLFQPGLEPAAPALSVRLILRALGAIVLCLVVVYGFARQRAGAESERVAELEAQKSLVSRRLEELERKLEQRAPSQALAQQVRELADTTEAHRALVQAVEKRAPGSLRGFSPELEGLARSSHPGVWLDRVSIQKGGEELLLVGHALDPKLVPEWLQRMNGEVGLTGRTFQTVRIERPAPEHGGTGAIDFALATGELAP